MANKIFKYFTAYSFYQRNCKQHKDKNRKPQSHWALNTFDEDGGHHWLQDGLNLMGSKGWELVGIQLETHFYGGVGNTTEPPHWYIFKKMSDD